jgi:putative NADPH-quinone reductase
MSKKILVIVAHPDLQKSRINRAWIEHLRRRSDEEVEASAGAYVRHVLGEA